MWMIDNCPWLHRWGTIRDTIKKRNREKMDDNT